MTLGTFPIESLKHDLVQLPGQRNSAKRGTRPWWRCSKVSTAGTAVQALGDSATGLEQQVQRQLDYRRYPESCRKSAAVVHLRPPANDLTETFNIWPNCARGSSRFRAANVGGKPPRFRGQPRSLSEGCYRLHRLRPVCPTGTEQGTHTEICAANGHVLACAWVSWR